MVTAVDTRRVPKLFWNLREKLAQKENAERVCHERDSECPIGVNPGAARQRNNRAADQHVIGDQRNRFRDHHCRKENAKQKVLSLEINPPKGIASQN